MLYAKNYENWLRVDKVIAMNTVCSFFWPTLYIAADTETRTAAVYNATEPHKL